MTTKRWFNIHNLSSNRFIVPTGNVCIRGRSGGGGLGCRVDTNTSNISENDVMPDRSNVSDVGSHQWRSSEWITWGRLWAVYRCFQPTPYRSGSSPIFQGTWCRRSTSTGENKSESNRCGPMVPIIQRPWILNTLVSAEIHAYTLNSRRNINEILSVLITLTAIRSLSLSWNNFVVVAVLLRW